MTGLLGVTNNTDTELSQIITSNDYIAKEVTLKAGAGSLTRGAVLGLNTTLYKYTLIAPAGGTGENIARAILLNDAVDASVKEQKAIVLLQGGVHEDDLVWSAGITRFQKDAQILHLQDMGIIVDEDFSTALTTTTTTTTTTSSTTTTTAP